MTQVQDAEVQANNKPSAIVVGVGAEQGLGAALCRRFAAQGYHVFVAGRTSGNTPINLPGTSALIGRTLDVRITGHGPNSLRGVALTTSIGEPTHAG